MTGKIEDWQAWQDRELVEASGYVAESGRVNFGKILDDFGDTLRNISRHPWLTLTTLLIATGILNQACTTETSVTPTPNGNEPRVTEIAPTAESIATPSVETVDGSSRVFFAKLEDLLPQLSGAQAETVKQQKEKVGTQAVELMPWLAGKQLETYYIYQKGGTEEGYYLVGTQGELDVVGRIRNGAIERVGGPTRVVTGENGSVALEYYEPTSKSWQGLLEQASAEANEVVYHASDGSTVKVAAHLRTEEARIEMSALDSDVALFGITTEPVTLENGVYKFGEKQYVWQDGKWVEQKEKEYDLNYDPYDFINHKIPIEDLMPGPNGELSPFVKYVKEHGNWPVIDPSKLVYAPLKNYGDRVSDDTYYTRHQADYPTPETNPYQRTIYMSTVDNGGTGYFLSIVRIAVPETDPKDYPVLVFGMPAYGKYNDRKYAEGMTQYDEGVRVMIGDYLTQMNYPVINLQSDSSLALPGMYAETGTNVTEGIDILTNQNETGWSVEANWKEGWRRLDGAVVLMSTFGSDPDNWWH